MPRARALKAGIPLPGGGALAHCRHCCAVVAALVIGLFAAPMALGQQPLSDQQLKAAFLLNFIRYTEWPERAFVTQDSPLLVCILGDPNASGMAGIAGRTVKGRSVQVRAAASADDARGCHVLFIPETDARRFVGILRALHGVPVLTVSEADGFIDIGGMIGLVHIDNRLQFEVNLGVIQQSQLKASSLLLRLARNVIEARPR